MKPVRRTLICFRRLFGVAASSPKGSGVAVSRTIVWVALLLNMDAYGLAVQNVEHALELTIRSVKNDLKRGDEIPIVFRITNKGQTPYEYDDRDSDRSGRMPEYVLEARRTDGTVVADPWAGREEWFGGGLTRSGRIGPGESFEKTIPLNRWALVKQAGRYEVVGKYLYRVRDERESGRSGPIPNREVEVASTPIEIVVGERSAEEMGEYIGSLTEALKTADFEDAREQKRRLDSIITRVVYTCDERIAPTLIEMMYSDRRGNGAFWACHGLRFFLPRTGAIKDQLVNAARRRGLGQGMQAALEEYGCDEEVFGEAIQRAFESGIESALNAAANAAQDHPNDAYTEKLIELSLDVNNPARGAAIAAIAYNRTDEGVAVLKSLLKDDDKAPRTGVRYTIQQAYRRHPVRPERIDEDYTAALVEIARDANDPMCWIAVNQIVRTRTEEGAAALRAFIEDPMRPNPIMQSDQGLRVLRDWLQHRDSKMRDAAVASLRSMCEVPRGRPLRADDFGPEFQDFDARQKEAILAKLKEREAARSADDHPVPTKVDDRPAKWAKKLDVAGVENFHKVCDVLYRGAQPSAEGMKNLEKTGIKTVVNLRSLHSDRDEMKGTKMGYEHITMKVWHPEEKEIVRFLKIVTSKNNQPVFVHCQYGADRTGTMCALYRIAVQGWTKDDAIEEMTKGGFGYHGVWKNLVDYVEKRDIEKIKRKTGVDK